MELQVMTTMIESECISDAVAVEDDASKTPLSGFFSSVAAAEESGLFLDFDGTLARFRIDPAAARPWAGVRQLLQEIQQTGRTRIVIISGRPATDVASLLNVKETPEIWGLHGAERLHRDGTLEREVLGERAEAVLNDARRALEDAGFTRKTGLRVEYKWNAVAVHWRGASAVKSRAVQVQLLRLLRPFAHGMKMSLLEFDGGVELRAGRHKGDAVGLLLQELGPDAPVAYLGDDTTDEDAFVALRERGLGVLVRTDWRPTAARSWLRPPRELRAFLKTWARNVR